MPLKLIEPRPGKTPNWYIRGTYLGVPVDRSSGSSEKAVAARFRTQLKYEIERGRLAQSGEPTFLSAAVRYLKAGGDGRFLGSFDEETETWSGLIGHFGETALRAIDQDAIDDAAHTLYPKGSAQTRNRQVYTPVSAVLKFAGRNDHIRRPKGWRGKNRVNWLWPEQAFHLFRTADEIDPEFGIFLRTLLYTGMRLSDGLWLMIGRVKLDEGYAYLEDTKNGEPRGVHLPPVVVAALKRHPRGLDRQGRVFRFTKCGRLYELLGKVKAKAGKDYGFVTFHTLCHTYGTWMRRYAKLDLDGLVETQRWKDRASAAKYVHVDASEAARKADLLPVENEFGTPGEDVDLGHNLKRIKA